MSWTSRREAVLRGRGARHVVRGPEGDLSFACALELLRTDDAFRDFVTGLLTAHPCPALRWETPPICASRIARPFEFVLVDDPLLALAPEPEVFGPYFAPLPADTTVLAVPNLGRSAMLVVPRAAGVALDNRAELPNGRIAAIRAPTLILHAADDGLQRYHNAEFAAATIPHARLVRFEHGGHLLMAVEQASVREQVQSFILASAGG